MFPGLKSRRVSTFTLQIINSLYLIALAYIALSVVAILTIILVG